MYRKLLLIALTVLVSIPCSAKTDLKKWLNIESSHQVKNERHRISCSSYFQLQQQNNKENAGKHVLHFPVNVIVHKYRWYSEAFPLSELHKEQKEKIPFYLLFDRFLI